MRILGVNSRELRVLCVLGDGTILVFHLFLFHWVIGIGLFLDHLKGRKFYLSFKIKASRAKKGLRKIFSLIFMLFLKFMIKEDLEIFVYSIKEMSLFYVLRSSSFHTSKKMILVIILIFISVIWQS
jgi:hypothetical protein